MYNKHLNYSSKLNDRLQDLVYQLSVKHDIDLNLAAYCIYRLIEEDIVLSVIMDRSKSFIIDEVLSESRGD